MTGKIVHKIPGTVLSDHCKCNATTSTFKSMITEVLPNYEHKTLYLVYVSTDLYICPIVYTCGYIYVDNNAHLSKPDASDSKDGLLETAHVRESASLPNGSVLLTLGLQHGSLVLHCLQTSMNLTCETDATVFRAAPKTPSRTR